VTAFEDFQSPSSAPAHQRAGKEMWWWHKSGGWFVSPSLCRQGEMAFCKSVLFGISAVYKDNET